MEPLPRQDLVAAHAWPLGQISACELVALHRLRPGHYPVLLDSAAQQVSADTQHDILLAFPGASLEWFSGRGSVLSDGLELPAHATFLATLDAWWRRERTESSATFMPFSGGWFIYLSYELAEQIEPALSGRLPLQPGQLLAQALRVPAAVIRNSRTGMAWFVAEDQAAHRLPLLRSDLAAARLQTRLVRELPLLELQEDDPARFTRSVAAAQQHIAAGDIYQANLSRAWRAELPHGVEPADLYARLRYVNPAPFAALARLSSEHSIMSSSPERLLRVRAGEVSTRPIAGTRPRARDAAADALLLAELIAHPKERAEHVMLLDLERNDLGRICVGGSVAVNEYMSIETFAHVHHIVSNVRGRIRSDVTPGQAIAAVFPGGTITGCPKVRCMQVIADQEREARGAYTGSLGYLNLDGSMDLNILIRSFELQGRALQFRAGAGIVADSVAERELDETRAKALGLLSALPVRP